MRRPIVFAGLLASLALQGCNAGVGVLLGLLLSHDGHHHKKRSGEEVLAAVEFIALENARLRPAKAVIVLSLRNAEEEPAEIQVAFSAGGGAFRPASVSPPPSASLVEPGSLAGLATSSAGTVHRIPWNALADLGDDSLHKVRLRFTGGLGGPLLVSVLVGDDPPEIRDASFTQEEGEEVRIQLVLADSSLDPVDVKVEFATEEDGAGSRLYSPALSVAGNTGLAADAEGTPHLLEWDAVRDAGPFDRPAAVRLTPTDRIGGEVGKTGGAVERVIALDSNRGPEVEVLDGDVLTDPDQRRGHALRFVARDAEGNPVDAIVQWAQGDAPFPAFDAALDADPEARQALLRDPQARRSLQVASILGDGIEGPVELASSSTLPGPGEVLASWLKAASELRGLAGDCAPAACSLLGRRVDLVAPGGGASQSRSVCSYAPATGLLRVDSPFDPPPPPGSILRIDLGGADGPLRLAASPSGVLHHLIWDGAEDVPGGGAVRFRITPFDRVSAPAAGCAAAAGADGPGISAGGRGRAAESGGAKRVRGPFLDSDAWTAPLAPIDEPAALAALDIDGDGRMDLACAARSSSAVVLFLQKKRGVFDAVRLTDSRLQGPAGLVAGDLDGDGDVDLAVADDVKGRVLVIFQGPRLDFFSERAALAAGGELVRPTAITAGDLDGDGDVDLAVAEAGAPGEAGGRGVRVFFRGAGPAGCGAPEAGYSSCLLQDPNAGEPHAIAGAKITEGSSFDLVTAGSGFFAVYSLGLEGGELSFRYTRVEAPGSDLRSVAVADLDGNGTLDLVAPDRAGRSVRIASQTAQVGFGLLAPLASASLKGPLGIVQGDLDGNGVIDFAVADAGDPATLLGGNVSVFLGASSGRFSADVLERAPPGGELPGSPRAIAAADFDGDGRTDLASADDGSHEVVIFRQGGRGAFREPAVVLAAGQSLPAPASLAAADLGGDEKIDLLSASREVDAITLFEAREAGAFAALRIPLPPAEGPEGEKRRRGPVAVAAGDLSGDGRPDLVSANVDTNDLTVLLQEPGGDFLAFDVRPAAFLGPHAAALTDIDGDGRLDIVVAARFSDEARWFRQVSDGGFAEAGAFRAGGGAESPRILGPVFVAAGDLDSDGRVDVVTANHRSSNLTAFLQAEARGTFLAPIEVPLGSGVRPVAVALADVDGNGTTDIVSANLGPPAASVFLQTAAGLLEPSTIAAVSGVQPTSVAARDLDGDGKTDIALSFSGERGSFLKVYFQGEGDPLGGGRSIQRSGSSLSAPIALLAVDLDGDGEQDLASANRLSRSVTVFYGGR